MNHCPGCHNQGRPNTTTIFTCPGFGHEERIASLEAEVKHYKAAWEVERDNLITAKRWIGVADNASMLTTEDALVQQANRIAAL